MAKYLSGRFKKTPQSKLPEDRNRYLSVGDAEPNLGDPTIDSTEGLLPVGEQYQIISILGYSGERYWIPRGGGLIPGSISVYDENFLVGTSNSITQLNFVGAAITVRAVPLGIAATITVFSPGNNQEILFNTNNDFGTSSKLKFDSNIGLLSAGDRITVGTGGTVITTTSGGLVGIGTTNPTQELHIRGDLRLTGTIYDSLNDPGDVNQIIVKNNLGGLLWVDQGTIRSGAGGTYRDIQFHNSAGLVDGASNFVFDEVNSRIGIGSTQPKVLLDVLGISSFKGGTTIDNLNVTGITTTSTLAVSGTTTTRNLQVTGVTTIGFVTGTSAYFTGIVTATKFVGEVNVTNLYVSGISTFKQKVNIDSNLGVTGLTTTENLQVYQSTTLNRLNAGLSTFTTVDINGGEVDVTRIGTQNLNVSGIGTFSSQVNVNNLNVTGVGTFDNVKIYDNNIETTVGNLILNSFAGVTQINDGVYVTDTSQSISKDTGSIVTEGGVGIEKDLYVGGNLYVDGDIVADSADKVSTGTTTGTTTYFPTFVDSNNNPRSNEFLYTDAGISYNPSTDLLSSGNLGVSGLTTTRNLRVTGVGTFDGLLDANAGATIDNIQIGISADNEIDTSTGNLILDSAGGTTTIDDNVSITGNLTVSGISTFNGNVDLGNDANVDTVTFTSKINSSVLPSTNALTSIDVNGKDLGGTSNYWRKIYAREFDGQFIGNADTATKLSTPREIDISGDVIGVGIGTTFDGSRNVTIPTELSTTGVAAGTYGSSTQVGIVTVDSKGRITSASNIGVNFSTATVLNSDNIKTVTSSATTLYPTFVDSDNNPAAYEALYTDAGISYNASSNLLTLTNLTVSGISTFNGNVTLGDATSDTVTFTARINSSVLPSTNGTLDLGGTSNKWATVYATNFNGQFIGNADTATKLSTPREIDISGDVIGVGIGTTFDGSRNVTIPTELSTTGVVAGTYGSSTRVGIVTVDSKGRITSASNVNIDFSRATYADNAGISTNLKGGTASQIPYQSAANTTAFIPNGTSGQLLRSNGTSAPSWVTATDLTVSKASYADNAGISTNADNIKTVSSTATTLYPTFVDSNNSPAAYEALYTDAGITYNASTNLLTASNITVSGISTFNGNVTLGDATSDTVTFTARVDSSILPSTNGTLDLGGASNKWNNIYANSFVGTIIGNADTATKLATARNIAITGDLTWNVNFDGFANVTSAGTLANSGVVAGTYGSSTTVGIVTVDSKGRITSASNIGINFSTATVSQADNIKTVSSTATTLYPTFVDSNNSPAAYEALYTDAGITYNASTNSLSVSGDLAISGTSTFNGNVDLGNATSDTVTFTARVDSSILPSTNGTLDLGGASNKWNNIYANSFVGTIIGNADTASQVSTGTTTGTGTYYPTFVDSNNSTRGNEFLYTDAGISYNASTNSLSVSGDLAISGSLNGVEDLNGGPLAGFRNLAINGNFDIWQRGTTATNTVGVSGGTRVADRWACGVSLPSSNSPSGTFTVSQQNCTSTEFSYFNASFYQRLSTNNINIGTVSFNNLLSLASSTLVIQNIENAVSVLGKTLTLSFWARASTATKIVSENQIYSTSAPCWTPTICKTFDLTTTWQKFTHTYTMPTYSQVIAAAYNPSTVDTTLTNPTYTPMGEDATLPLVDWLFQIDIKTAWSLGEWRRHGNAYSGSRPSGFEGTQQTLAEMQSMNNSFIANGYYDIAQIQLEPGPVDTPFELRPRMTELALCQRYFCKSYNVDVAPGTTTAIGKYEISHGTGATENRIATMAIFPVTMRINPSVTIYNNTTGASNSMKRDNSHVTPTLENAGEKSVTVSSDSGEPATSISFHYTANAEI